MRHYFKYSIFCSILCLLVSCQGKIQDVTGENVPTTESSLLNSSTESGENIKKKNISVSEFIRWCMDEQNELNKTLSISEVKYNLSYMPKENLAYLELKTESYDLEKFKKTSDHYKDMIYFNLRIAVPEAEGELLKYKLTSPAEYEQRIKYLSFGVQDDIFITQGKDTIKPGLCQYERIFEVAPYATIQIAFDKKKLNPEEGFTFVYNDKLLEKGYVKFTYKTGQLVNLPNITSL